MPERSVRCRLRRHNARFRRIFGGIWSEGRREGGDGATTSPLVHVEVSPAVHLLFNETKRSLGISPYVFLTMGVLLGHIQGALDDMKVVNYGADTRDFMFNI